MTEVHYRKRFSNAIAPLRYSDIPHLLTVCNNFCSLLGLASAVLNVSVSVFISACDFHFPHDFDLIFCIRAMEMIL